jgi:hypothetical protein
MQRTYLLALLTLLAVVTGCGTSHTRYVPASTSARQAVETALKTWQSGTAHGPISDTKPAINVFDARWRDGKKLESFEFVEEVAAQEHPQFKFRLKLANQAEAETTYHVVGIDPLNVFADTDYKKASGQ